MEWRIGHPPTVARKRRPKEKERGAGSLTLTLTLTLRKARCTVTTTGDFPGMAWGIPGRKYVLACEEEGRTGREGLDF